MVKKITALILSIASLTFVPLLPLSLLSSVMLFFNGRSGDSSGTLFSKKGLVISFILTSIIGVVCVLVAEYLLPYSNFYSAFVRNLFKTLGILSLFLSIKNLVAKG